MKTDMYYFTGCDTVAQTKKQYRSLSFLYHPDMGGDVETMKSVNVQYHKKLKSLDGLEITGADNVKRAYRYNETVEQELLDKLHLLLNLKMENVSIDIIGTWLWVYGNTRPYKQSLKTLSLRWHSKREKWYYSKPSNFKKRYCKHMSYEDIKKSYGIYNADNVEVKNLNA